MKTLIFGIAFLAVMAGPVFAQDAERGRQLYENHCLSCHYERIHKREADKSLVKSLAQLRVQVAERARLTGQRLGVEDLDDIAEYLNRSHYRFSK